MTENVCADNYKIKLYHIYVCVCVCLSLSLYIYIYIYILKGNYIVLWDVMLRSLVDGFQCGQQTCCFSLHSRTFVPEDGGFRFL
jgi:hypothetical protein